MSTLFPFTVFAVDYETCVQSYRPLRDVVVHECEKRRETWFAYHVEFMSPTTAKISVRDIFDLVYGGIGPENFSFITTFDASLSKPAMVNKARQAAETRREHELREAEEELIQRYMGQILEGA